jgi:molybdate/tungstate transport system substrate-binding protein
VKRTAFLNAAAAAIVVPAAPVLAQAVVVLNVAYAGSMGSMMQGPVARTVASSLGVTLRGRGQGSDALAQLISGGTIAADAFIPVTPGPMMTVLRAGKASIGVPIARTEMVIAYNPRGRFANAFRDAASGKREAAPWYEILRSPGLRFGRSDPAVDPQGRNIIFTLQLAERHYHKPGLADAILGQTINPKQIFAEATIEARLQSGELDAAAAYKTQPGAFGLPFVTLPDAVNLGNASMSDAYRTASLELHGKTYHPQALVYYAAALHGSSHPARAQAFVHWFATDAGRAILRAAHYDPPAGAVALT